MRNIPLWPLLLAVLLVFPLAVLTSFYLPSHDELAVRSTSPRDAARGYPSNDKISVEFGADLDPASVSTASFILTDSAGARVPGAVRYDAATEALQFVPEAPLTVWSTYEAVLPAGDAGVRSISGTALASAYAWRFETGGPAPQTGPGGPVLVLASDAAPFSYYYAEILRSEGVSAFAVADIADLHAALLVGVVLVILGDISLTEQNVSTLSKWVNAGGKLVAMRPDASLAPLFGLSEPGAQLSEAYLAIDPNGIGRGIAPQRLQYHGPADVYGAVDATPVAQLYEADGQTPIGPAVTLKTYPSGGQAAAFMYDLARSVVFTRQGNPSWSGQDRDSMAPIRSNDLFFGGDEADYLDMDNVAIPQADEQQRLLINLMNAMTQDRQPLPRFWYFPRDLKAVVVMTGDDHGRNGTEPQFTFYEAQSPVGCSVENWECVRSTSYIFPETPIAAAKAAAFVDMGFEIGVHVRTSGVNGCRDFSRSSLDADYTTQMDRFHAAFPEIQTIQTMRVHCIVWSDYVSQPAVALQHGVRLDTNYYFWPGSWVKDRPGMFTGSGMPMRFATETGEMIDVYQAATQMTDESYQTYPDTTETLLDRALGTEGYYGAFVANMHTDAAFLPDAWKIVAAARARDVPVISAGQLLAWVDARNAASHGAFAWDGNALDFTITTPMLANGLQTMLPAQFNGMALQQVQRDGGAVPFAVSTIKGGTYASFASPAGSYTATYGP